MRTTSWFRARRGATAVRLAGAAMLVLLAACGGGDHDHDPGAAAPSVDGHDHDHDHSAAAPAALTFGTPGTPEAATRTVKVSAGDPYRFAPQELELNGGETVTFVVSNEGEQVHEFVLGDQAYQDSHAEAMAAGEMHHQGNAVTVAPGETQKLTWTFPAAAGEILYGCHVQGHYAAGMFGTIRLSA